MGTTLVFNNFDSAAIQSLLERYPQRRIIGLLIELFCTSTCMFDHFCGLHFIAFVLLFVRWSFVLMQLTILLLTCTTWIDAIEVADTIIYLLSDRASAITGELVAVDARLLAAC